MVWDQIEDIQRLNSRYIIDPESTSTTICDHNWEIFDGIISISSNCRNNQVHNIFQCVKNVWNHVKSAELQLMAFEKFYAVSQGREVLSTQILLYTVTLSMNGSNFIEHYKKVFLVLLKFISRTFNDDRKCNTEEDINHNWFNDVLISVLNFLTGLTEMRTDWEHIISNECSSLNFSFSPCISNEIQGLIIGLLSTLCRLYVAQLSSLNRRQKLFQFISRFTIKLSPNLFDVFNFIFHAKHQLYLEKRENTLKKNNKKTIERRSNQATASSNGDYLDLLHSKSPLYYLASRVLHRHIESENQAYGDKVAITRSHSDLVLTSNCTGLSLDACIVSQSITDDDIITAYQRRRDIHSNSLDAESGSMVRCGDLFISDESGLCWSITGLSVIILHIITSITTVSESPADISPSYPAVFSPQHLQRLAFEYIPHLLQTPLAGVEGMQAIIALGRLSLTVKRRYIFISPLCSADTDSLLDIACRSKHLKTSSLTIPIEFKEDGGIFSLISTVMSLSSHNKMDENSITECSKLIVAEGLLIKIAGESKDLLWLTQSIISAMMACVDNSLRSAALIALKQLMSNVEELGRFELLLAICDTCPHPQVTGLMVDFAKELSQAASRIEPPMSISIPVKWWPSGSTRDDLLSLIFDVTPQNVSEVEDDVVYLSRLLKMDIKGHPTRERLLSYDFYSALVSNNNISPSVFWSPLLIHSFVLQPLEEMWAQGTDRKTNSATPYDQLQQGLDVVAARVNMMLFVTLRLQSSFEKKDSHAQYVYFMSLKDRHGSNPGFYDDGVETVKDLFRVCKVVLKLKDLLNLNVDGDSDLPIVLLKSNVDYLFQRICSFCRSILNL